jgi:hypothetical protein
MKLFKSKNRIVEMFQNLPTYDKVKRPRGGGYMFQ